MPVYEFKCQVCGRKFDEFAQMNNIKVRCCGILAQRVYTPPAIKITFTSFLANELRDKQGKKIYFNTQKQKEEYYRQNDLIDTKELYGCG